VREKQSAKFIIETLPRSVRGRAHRGLHAGSRRRRRPHRLRPKRKRRSTALAAMHRSVAHLEPYDSRRAGRAENRHADDRRVRSKRLDPMACKDLPICDCAPDIWRELLKASPLRESLSPERRPRSGTSHDQKSRLHRPMCSAGCSAGTIAGPFRVRGDSSNPSASIDGEPMRHSAECA